MSVYAKYNRESFRHYRKTSYVYVIPYPEYKTQSFRFAAHRPLDLARLFGNDETVAVVVVCKFVATV